MITPAARKSVKVSAERGSHSGRRGIASRNLREDYCLMIPQRSPLRESINRALLTTIREPIWQDVLRSYLGNY
jgi:hypothetical protein